jgi:hypothetical protein
MKQWLGTWGKWSVFPVKHIHSCCCRHSHSLWCHPHLIIHPTQCTVPSSSLNQQLDSVDVYSVILWCMGGRYERSWSLVVIWTGKYKCQAICTSGRQGYGLKHHYYLGKKVKVNLSLCLTKHYAMKTYWGSEGIAPRILDLGTRWR